MAFPASPVRVLWGEGGALTGERASYGEHGICSARKLAMRRESKGLLLAAWRAPIAHDSPAKGGGLGLKCVFQAIFKAELRALG